MRVAIDGRMVLTRPTGIGRVTEHLVRALGRVDSANHYSVLCRPGAMTDLEDIDRFRRVETDVGQYSPRVFTELPRLLSREKPDLIHFSYFFHPVLMRAPYVVTIFDTVYSYYPGYLSLKKRIAYRAMMRLSISRCQAVLTDSESAKRDVIKFFGVEESRIRVIPLGVESRFRCFDRQQSESFISRYGLPERYILYVGNHKPHKNVPALVKAFARITGEIPHKLVLTGGQDPGCHLTRQEVVTRGIEERVICLTDFPDADLPALYNAADLFVFPSLCEGFGLPPLEAMACGTPVITSNVSSLPEVVGDAGITVDPSNAEVLAGAVLQVLRDPSVGEEMSAKGVERAKTFSWEKTARQTRAVYQEVCDGTKPGG